MAVQVWLGRAQAVAQVSTVTLGGTVAANDTFTVTINAKDVTYTATGSSVADACTGLAALLNAATAPLEHGELTWAATSTTVVGTGDVAGVPHTITVSQTGASNTISHSVTTAATGPNHWDNADNWQSGSVPSAADTFDFAHSNESIRYGWPGSDTEFGECVIHETYEADWGLPAINSLGYREYRPRWAVNVSFSNLKIWANGQVFRLAHTQADALIELLGNSELHLVDTPDTTDIDVRNGELFLGDDTDSADSDADEITVAPNASATIGDDCTVATLVSAGTVVARGTVTDVTVHGGTTTLEVAPDAADVQGGTLVPNFGGTLAALTYGPGLVDLSGDMSAITITAITKRQDGQLFDPWHRITGTSTLTLSASAL